MRLTRSTAGWWARRVRRVISALWPARSLSQIWYHSRVLSERFSSLQPSRNPAGVAGAGQRNGVRCLEVTRTYWLISVRITSRKMSLVLTKDITTRKSLKGTTMSSVFLSRLDQYLSRTWIFVSNPLQKRTIDQMWNQDTWSLYHIISVVPRARTVRQHIG